jgi:transposase
VLQSRVIHTDDTSIKMLQPGAGVTLTAKFWPYLGDWLHPYVAYDFTLTREREGPLQFLEGFNGYLQADAYYQSQLRTSHFRRVVPEWVAVLLVR